VNTPSPTLLCPERVRKIERPFSWIPFRLLSSGLLAQLGRDAKLLYFFLCLVADRQGLSFYGNRRVQTVLSVSERELTLARTELVNRDLLAFDGRVYQLLSLPSSTALQAGVYGRGSPRDLPAKRPRCRSDLEQLHAILRRLESTPR